MTDNVRRNYRLAGALNELAVLAGGLHGSVELRVDVDGAVVAMLVPREGRAVAGRGTDAAAAVRALHAELQRLVD